MGGFVEQLNKKARFVMVINYYTGEKWYLVEVNGVEKYVSEAEYKANFNSQRHETEVQEVPKK